MRDYKPFNVLVTGGAGFIGSNFIRYLLATDENVRIVNLDLLTYAGSMSNLRELLDSERHLFVQGDICDKSLVEALLRNYEIDTIVHFAAESHVDRSITNPEIFIKTNVFGTFNLLETARVYWLHEQDKTAETCRFYHISTDEVYGSLTLQDPPFTEKTPYAPNSPYSTSKASSNHLVRSYFHTYGLPVITSNCSNNYGPYQHTEKFIPTVIRACLNKQSIPIYGDGSNIRDWLYVDDHCHGIDILMRKGQIGETYNIGGNNECSNLEVVKKICLMMDEYHPDCKPHDRLIQFVNDRPGHDWRYAINSDKIFKELEWTPKVNFAEGINKVIEWYQHN